MAIITEIRREKAEKHLPLNAKITKLVIYAEENKVAKMITQGQEDIKGTCKAQDITVLAKRGDGREIKPYNIHASAEYEGETRK